MRRAASGQFDAIVIGGGPAGALTALWLARFGWRTALIERGVRHRAKTCGHCLPPRAFAVLDRAGLLDDVRALAACSTGEFRVHVPTGRSLRLPLVDADSATAQCGLVIERCRFDQLLVDAAAAAGAAILQPASGRVLSLHDDEAIVQVRQGDSQIVLRSPLVIGADGVGSQVARASRFTDQRTADRKYGFSFDWNCGAPTAARQPTSIEMHIINGGYLGMVDQGGGRLHCAALVSDQVDGREPLMFVRRVALQHSWLREIGLHRARRKDLVNFTAVGPMPWRPHTVAGPRTALVGDAAGYIEPFTGEGMSWALASADLLANTVADGAPGAWNAEIAGRFQELWKRTVQRRHFMCRMLAGALARRGLASWIVRGGSYFPSIARRMVNQAVAT